ncbi:contact-dependent growth inhibition system immunity protein [Flavihumibacter sp. CACIAM 22H1]|uniref:contact-dependent growth inhibition system immunity protein n=1 Tax=Flavihumibacter sp. CACIAM 22H1 TaxID=1812911 RepID=UPI00344D3934
MEKQNFGHPGEAPTNMVRRCLELRRIPIDEFTVEDLRLMIGQNFSLRYLAL